ncbi:proenkephalin-B-like [Sphaeramia orbicularis]|uniref:Proenkephalin-B-like n=1 Tax=Sphaeramia orbicularis TaxID=375764 RepID=A0A673AVU6_9TELE|nr:proenkephalin-B-like [Sphaeramia orbicularis]
MKIPVWCLVVLLPCLFSPGRSDCQGQCVACGLILQQQQLQQTFNTMVCLLECEGHVTSSLTWEVCKRAVRPSFLFKRDGEQVDVTSEGEELLQEGEELLQEEEGPSEQLGSSEEGLGLGLGPGLDLGLSLDGDRKPRDDWNAETEEDEDGVSEDGVSEAVALSKRFGGFQRGRHGYRKLMGGAPPVRALQKRYGGFIGVRKSARKWNSQKRVNQLLRQYLGLRSSRSGARFNGGGGGASAGRAWRRNQL